MYTVNWDEIMFGKLQSSERCRLWPISK